MPEFNRWFGDNGDQTRLLNHNLNSQSVVFEVDLKAGANDLLTKMELENGKVRGSYFAYLKRIGK